MKIILSLKVHWLKVHSNWLIFVYWVLGFLDDYVPSRQYLKQLSAGSLVSGRSFVLVRKFHREMNVLELLNIGRLFCLLIILWRKR